ncbi:hypothetical protein NW762_003159 [Fusarium torreyae]|uniref:HhH-GPD domain-containing protein n=1 Tax=Fusarium torreyae TaxID=1237075 RepID=A0A9W8S9H4_9HYPO|nr:hypothetical protein NW762_003159 [Fusarium torreyae]
MLPLRRSARVARQLSYNRVTDEGKIGKSPTPTTRRTRGPSHLVAKSLALPLSSGDKRRGVDDDQLAEKKWKSWSAHATSSPFPEFGRPTRHQCEKAYRVLHENHNQAVETELSDPYTSDTIPHVLDAMVVVVLSQATSWKNAKRAIHSLEDTYGSTFAYDDIFNGGMEKLQDALRCGGLHIRKSKIIMSILEQVQHRHGTWSIDHLFNLSNKEAMEDLISYKYIGPKSAFVVMGWCLKKNVFTVDTHVYRIAGLWGWRPKEASREMAQAHLDALVPAELKWKLHLLLVAHGRVCPACRGGSSQDQTCSVHDAMLRIAAESL